MRRAAFYPDRRGEDFHGQVGLEEEGVCLGRKRASKGLRQKKKKTKAPAENDQDVPNVD